MKSVAVERPRSNILGVKKDSNCSIMKTAAPGLDFRGEKGFALSEEMKECFLQLSNMVPTEVPRNESGNIDGTVLMQYVIDYILDLELQLGGAGGGQTLSQRLSSIQRLADSCREAREPLSEKSIENIVHTSQTSSASSPLLPESLVQRTADCEIRPPSK